MFDITKPVFGNWVVDEMLGSGSYGTVYKIKREDFGKTYYSALKVVEIPQSETEIKDMLSEFGDIKSVSDYYTDFVRDFAKEIELMSQLKGSNNIVSIEDHQFVQSEDGVGWTIFIKMELLKAFTDYEIENKMSTEDVVKLGIDICNALMVCDTKKIIHRDIKPDNIFYSFDGHFKLGDFGIARELDKTMGGLSKKGTYTYMAPEVYKGDSYNKSVDIYSLGMVMYRLLNSNRGPFLPEAPKPITYHDREESMSRRMNGEIIPGIPGISKELNRIVLKACAYNIKNRYSSAESMKNDLEAFLLSGLKDFDSKTVADDKAESFVEPKEDAKGKEQNKEPKTKSENKGSKKKLIAIPVALLVVLCVVAFLAGNGNSGKRPTNEIVPSSTEAAIVEENGEPANQRPGDAANVRVFSKTTSTATLVWDEADGASEYHIFRYNAKGNYTDMGKTSETKFTIKGLSANTNYTFFVQAKNNDNGTWSKNFSNLCYVQTNKASSFAQPNKSQNNAGYNEDEPDDYYEDYPEDDTSAVESDIEVSDNYNDDTTLDADEPDTEADANNNSESNTPAVEPDVEIPARNEQDTPDTEDFD